MSIRHILFATLWSCIFLAGCSDGVAPIAANLAQIAPSQSFSSLAKKNFFDQQVAVAYGENDPTLQVVDPRWDSNPDVTSVYIITLVGNFKKGNLHADKLEYRISPDGKRIWDVKAYNGTNPNDKMNKLMWLDNNFP